MVLEAKVAHDVSGTFIEKKGRGRTYEGRGGKALGAWSG